MLFITGIAVCKLILVCKVCMGEPTGTNQSENSEKCAAGTYYSAKYITCLQCTMCDVYSRMAKPCTSTSDTVCIRCADTTESLESQHPTCKKCPPCKAGEYMEKGCTENTSTVCRACVYGSFNENASYKPQCLPCTACDNQVMVRDCTASLDTLCGQCKRGFFKDPSNHQCIPCSSCAPGQEPMKGCEGGRPGKMCSPLTFYRVEYVVVPDINVSITPVALQTTTLSPNETILIPMRNIQDNTHEDVLIFASLSVVAVIFTIICAIFRYRFAGKRKSMFQQGDDCHLISLDDANYGDIETTNSLSFSDARLVIKTTNDRDFTFEVNNKKHFSSNKNSLTESYSSEMMKLENGICDTSLHHP